MIDKLLDRLAQAGTFRTLFQSVASLFGVMTVGWSLGFASLSRSLADSGDGSLAALGGTPLAFAYRGLNFLGIPNGWVTEVSRYLAANPDRAVTFGVIAALHD